MHVLLKIDLVIYERKYIHAGMEYVEQYIEGCCKLAQDIDKYLADSGKGPTYFCIKAGVHQAALSAVRSATARPDTVRKLHDHLKAVTAKERETEAAQ